MANSAPAADFGPAADFAPAADSAPAAESTPAADSAPAVKIVSAHVTKALEAEASSSQPPRAKTEYAKVRSAADSAPFSRSTPAADSAPAVKIVSADVTKALEAEASSSQRPRAKTEYTKVRSAADSAPFSQSTPAADSAPAVKIVSAHVTKALEAEASSSQPPRAKTELSVEEKYQLVRSIGEECIQEDELRNLLAMKPNPIAYDGFEPSGRMHIAQGVMKVINVNKLAAAGCTVKIWIADWFAKLNNKMGGDMKKIQTVGRYFIEIWKATGMQLENVQFLWSSEEINNNAEEYWMLMAKIAIANTLPRMIRCCKIMGRKDTDELTYAQIFYPSMQCADVFLLKADICQLGMDQRKVNVLAREYCRTIKRKEKPIILSHHMLPGLQQGQEKMSKSDPSSSIYMEDGEAEVNLKIKKSYCPPQIVEGNPCLEYLKYIIFPWFKKIEVLRKPENGGNKEYSSFDGLVEDYVSGALHPSDLKPALAKAINEILQPVRKHFETDRVAEGLLKAVKSYKVTK